MKRFTARADAPPAGPEDDRDNLCKAEGCPNWWSIGAEDGKVCRFHHGQPISLWPRITRQQLDAEAERAFERSQPPFEAPPMPKQDKLDVLVSMRAVLAQRGPQNPRAWIARLQARQAAGECLGLAQRQCLEEALRFEKASQPDDLNADEQRRREDEKNQQQQGVREYAEREGIDL